VYLHPLDEPLYRVGGRQAQLYGIPYEEPPSPDLLSPMDKHCLSVS
jgi:hypothetical protein